MIRRHLARIEAVVRIYVTLSMKKYPCETRFPALSRDTDSIPVPLRDDAGPTLCAGLPDLRCFRRHGRRANGVKRKRAGSPQPVSAVKPLVPTGALQTLGMQMAETCEPQPIAKTSNPSPEPITSNASKDSMISGASYAGAELAIRYSFGDAGERRQTGSTGRGA